ncbi:MAG: hypothetical protein WAP47_16420 [Candidatus Rokuibacteriota bacterium]
MKSWAVCAAWVCSLVVGGAVASAQESSFTRTESGFVYVVTGVEDVEAIARSVPGIAEGSALVDQSVLSNQVDEQNAVRRSVLQGSLQNNVGIFMVNQDAGNLNNQANVRILVLAEGGSLAQELSLAGVTRRIGNSVISSGGSREARIVGSFGGTVGIVGVNQSAGNLTQQANVAVIGIGLVLGPDASLLGDTSLGVISAGNTLIRGSTAPEAAVLTDSFAGFRGIAQVNQSTSDGNIARNFLGLSLTVLDVR